MLEQLEPKTDNEVIDITDCAERPSNDKRSPQHAQKYIKHTVTQGHSPTPQTSPTHIAMNATAVPAKPHQMEIQGNPPGQKKNTLWMAHMSKETATQGSL